MAARQLLFVAVCAALVLPWQLADAQHQHGAAAPESAPATPPRASSRDGRVAVLFPAELREHTLANMRDDLLALQEIQAALAAGQFDRAATTAEKRLGMSSLTAHGAHQVAPYMPKGMQEAGSAMHRSASRLSVAALDAAVTNDMKPALAAMADVTGNCVACHAGYRLQ